MSAALEKRKEGEQPPVSVPGTDTPRRSQRLMAQADYGRLQVELDQCRAELFTKTHGKLKLKTLLRLS